MSTSSIPGTNVPPISFPGISSGIDYNSIITKLTSLTLAPATQVNAQMVTLNNANSELITINGLLASVQNSLAALSDPNLFDAYDAISGNTNAASAQGITGTPAVAGTYVIDSTQVATSTQVESSATAGHSITDNITSGPYAGQASDTVPLVDSFAAISPTNGTSGQGRVTIDGVTVSYDVTTQSLQTILANVNTAVKAVDASFNISDTGGVAAITDNNAVTLGSAADRGNLLQVLKLDGAQIVNTGTNYTVTGTSGIGGLNQTAPLNATTAAGFKTAVTSGSITINGVTLSVSATGDNLASVISRINASNAGVTASYDGATNQITLTNSATGPQSIVLGSSSDTSNFLSAAGLTSASGATTVAGAQAEVVIQTPSGGTKTIFSNSNQVTTAIPGVQLNLQSNVTGQPFTINVSQDTSQVVSALNGFVSSYNAAITEINTSTAPPVVTAVPAGSSLSASSPTSFPGGVLYGNADVDSIKNELTNLVSGFLGSQNQGYNSLAQLGLQLSDSFTTLTTGNNGSSSGQAAGSSSNPVQATTFQGTDGTLQALNVAQFQAALQADPTAVQDILNGAQGLTNQVGSYLTGVTGLPTQLNSGLVGNIPIVSLIQGFENSNTSEIAQLQDQLATIQDNANSQADTLRAEFVASETAIAGYQALQQQLNATFGTSSSSSSSSSSSPSGSGL
jgi:flagellar hook-associated protein 2